MGKRFNHRCASCIMILCCLSDASARVDRSYVFILAQSCVMRQVGPITHVWQNWRLPIEEDDLKKKFRHFSKYISTKKKEIRSAKLIRDMQAVISGILAIRTHFQRYFMHQTNQAANYFKSVDNALPSVPNKDSAWCDAWMSLFQAAKPVSLNEQSMDLLISIFC